jgi:hypothetical protein
MNLDVYTVCYKYLNGTFQLSSSCYDVYIDLLIQIRFTYLHDLA